MVRNNFRVHFADQDFLVIGAVENTNMPAPGHRHRGTPQKVVIEFGFAWALEGSDLDAVWIDTAEYRTDGAILAGCVQGLEDYQQAVAVVGVHHPLPLIYFVP